MMQASPISVSHKAGRAQVKVDDAVFGDIMAVVTVGPYDNWTAYVDIDTTASSLLSDSSAANQPVVPPTPIYLLEHGLITWYPVPDYPLPIGVGDSLESYFSTSGYPDGYSSGYYPTKNYIAQTPDSFYAGKTGSSSKSALGSVYTGIMRLAVQAKVGAMLDINDLCGSGELDETRHGLVFAPDGTAWSIDINGSSVVGYKLDYIGTEDNRIDDPYSTNFSDQDEVVALATHLQYLKRSSESAVSLLTLSATGAALGSPAAYGWKWSYKNSVAAIVKIETVAGSTDPNWTPALGLPQHEKSAVFKITIDWALEGGSYVPSATESTVVGWSEYRRRAFVNNLWKPYGNNYILNPGSAPSSIESYNVFGTNTSPQYCWYKPDGSLHVVNHKGNVITFVSGTYYDNRDCTRSGGSGWYCNMKPGVRKSFNDSTLVNPISLESFSCSDYSFVGNMLYESGSNLNIREWFCADDGRTTTYSEAYYQQACNRAPCCAGGPCSTGTYGWKTQVNFLSLSGYDKKGDISSDFRESLIIDAYDAEHVFITKRFKKRENYNEKWNITPNGNSGGWYSVVFIKGTDTKGPFLCGTSNENNSQDISYHIMTGWCNRIYAGASDTTDYIASCALVGSSGANVIAGFEYDTLPGFFPISILENEAVNAHTWAMMSMFGGVGAVNNDGIGWKGFEPTPFGSCVFIGAA